MARMNRVNGTISFTSYNRYDEINAYLDVLAEKYPTRVTVETLGTTEEGREIKVIKISSNGGNDPNKPIIVSDAGVHAREWIAPATAMYMITKLVEDITERDVADNVDWFIIPLTNPDGYEYTHTRNRMWRKNMSTATSTFCPGVDANRNYDFKWSNSGDFGDPISIDWAMGVGDVNLSYVIELPPKNGTYPGFELPPSDIEQVVKETWGGILVFARYVMNKSV
ncbi:carboxypeptidase B-like [Arctopsyche grandis]|uniref:carboxypeptidase B-like n=1 Tax=Arctopsyche grandis TaxID=121162 RepID=UPI00406DA0C8